jgi:hypothetical protein
LGLRRLAPSTPGSPDLVAGVHDRASPRPHALPSSRTPEIRRVAPIASIADCGRSGPVPTRETVSRTMSRSKQI